MQRTQTITQQQPGRAGKIPLGMLMLLGYIAYTVIAELIHLADLNPPTRAFGALMITGLPAIGYSVGLIAALAGAFYGLLRRKVWAREIAIVWLIIGMAAPALNLAGFLLDPEGMAALVRGYVQQYFQDYARNMQMPLDPSSVVSLLIDKRVLLLFLGWDLLLQWTVGIMAIIYLNRQKTFFRA
jgi:hypothetical protein